MPLEEDAAHRLSDGHLHASRPREVAYRAGRLHALGHVAQLAQDVDKPLPAGEPQAFGTYPEGTLFRMVSDALDAMHQAISASPATE